MPRTPAYFAALLILVAMLLLGAGCATPGPEALRPGVSLEADVSRVHGRPTRVWPEADGGQTLEFSSQPFGRSCYVARLDAAGRLVSIEDTLRYASRFSIAPGLTPEQVSRRLGQERSRVSYHFSGEEVWDWNVEPETNGHLLRFNVHFKGGVVLRTSQSLVFPEDRFPGR